MIPKIIHYCWFGNNPKSKLMEKCIESWHKFCPDYEIIEWNETNIDISDCLYAQQALENKKWAFLSDYVRYKVIYEHGGIYLDTDVELIKPLEPLLSHKAYFCFEDDTMINTGLGFGAQKNHPIVFEMCEAYRSMKLFFEDGSINSDIIPVVTTRVLLKHGLKTNNTLQQLDDVVIFPTEYFAPKNYNSMKAKITDKTYSIHWYESSWQTKKQRNKHKKEILYDFIIHLPNKIVLTIFGTERYNKIKQLIKKS